MQLSTTPLQLSTPLRRKAAVEKGNHMTPAISIRDLTVAYGERPVFSGLSADIAPGRITGLVGPNGCGKSTLLGAVLGSVPARSGSVTIAHDAAAIGYMPQTAGVDWDFPITVADTVLMGTYGSLGWFARPRAAHRQRAAAAMEEVGISELARQPIGELSGGQRKRTFLARLLAQDSDLLIMDEPFAGVDTRSEAAIRQVLTRRHAAGATIVLVHHDLGAVSELCHEAIVLGGGQAVAGPVDEVLTASVIDRAYGLGRTHEVLQ
nr:metal ABC transporter ATP-binding protein [Brevibacterium otitidis]